MVGQQRLAPKPAPADDFGPLCGSCRWFTDDCQNPVWNDWPRPVTGARDLSCSEYEEEDT
jgi:hypothetical protein